MKRYMIDLNDKRYTVDIQDMPDGSLRVLVGDKWYTIKASPGIEVGQDWGDTPSRIQQLPPVINITMPEQPTPVFNMPAPVVNVSIPKQPAPIVNIPQQPAPIINVPQQPAPVVNMAAPIVNIPQQERQAPPIINVQVPEQPAPVVNVAPADVNVSIPDINLRAGSIAKVKRDYTGKITEITSNASVEGNA